MHRSLRRAFLLAGTLVLLLGTSSGALTTTSPSSEASQATTLSSSAPTTALDDPKDDASTLPSASAAASTASPLSSSDVLQEVGRLLGEMREVAASMQEAREEHGRLAHAVAQISAAVRDMGEHNIHIKKKVRKMSKALNRSSHHHKVKDGLKSLQRDHQRILHAMSLNGINVSRPHHNANHTHNHTNHGLGHNGTHRNHHHNHHNHKDQKEHHDDDDDDEDEHDEEHHEEAENKASAAAVASEAKQPKNDSKAEDDDLDDLDDLDDGEDNDNKIPELVVDPPGPTDPPLPVDCTEVMQRGNWTSGAYLIQPRGLQPIKAFCDQKTNGGGWTFILARKEQESQENFNRNWDEYKSGFGDPTGEHWLGLEALHTMIKGRNHELRVNITDWNGGETWAEWKEFGVAAEDKSYRLKVSRYASSSQAGDALKWHNGMKFSTPDRDNDALLGGHCAKKNDGGWWYRGHRGCYQAHPTGRYQHNPGNPPPPSANSRNFDMGPVLVWQNWRGESYYPRSLFLMFRPALN